MPKTSKTLLIGSTEPHSGKSAAILGLAFQLQACGLHIAYGKPVGTCLNGTSEALELDVAFIAQTLGLSTEDLRLPLLSLNVATIEDQMSVAGEADYLHRLGHACQEGAEDLLLLEGPGTLDEGALFDLSLPQIAATIDAPVLLVTRFHSALVVDTLLSAKQRLGDRLIGVVINDIPDDQVALVETRVKDYLERHGIAVLAMMPRAPLMRSISVREIVHKLNAEVLCCPDRLDLMVETLTIGAMNVNSALRYFRKGINMAVVTGGDRTDIQLAALETSTQCMVLTGHISPSEEILGRARDMEVPILSVDSDTLTTVECIDEMFGQVRLHETVKVECARELMAQHLDLERFIHLLSLKLPVSAPQS